MQILKKLVSATGEQIMIAAGLLVVNLIAVDKLNDVSFAHFSNIISIIALCQGLSKSLISDEMIVTGNVNFSDFFNYVFLSCYKCYLRIIKSIKCYQI